MKKRVEKPTAKPAKAKNETARKTPPKAAPASTHDPMHGLLRGTHAHKVCGRLTP